jgi:hypothetical protein
VVWNGQGYTSTIQSLAYTYDPVGNIKTIDDYENSNQKQCFIRRARSTDQSTIDGQHSAARASWARGTTTRPTPDTGIGNSPQRPA